MARRNTPNNALVVRTFSYPTTTVGSGPDDADVRPLAGCTVTITQGPGPSLPTPQPLPDPQVTGPNGEVRFENLPEGTAANPYRISVVEPAGFRPPSPARCSSMAKAHSPSPITFRSRREARSSPPLPWRPGPDR